MTLEVCQGCGGSGSGSEGPCAACGGSGRSEAPARTPGKMIRFGSLPGDAWGQGPAADLLPEARALTRLVRAVLRDRR